MLKVRAVKEGMKEKTGIADPQNPFCLLTVYNCACSHLSFPGPIALFIY